MFTRMTIARRLGLGFGVLLALLVVAVVLGLSRLATVDEMIDRIVELEWQKTVLANGTMDLMNEQTRDTYLMFHVPDQDHPAIRNRITERVRAIASLLEQLDKLVYHPEGKALLVEIREKRKIYVDSFSNVSSLLEGGRREDASRMIATETVPALDILLGTIDRLIRLQGRILEESGEASHAVYRSARNQLIGFLVLAVVLSVVMSIWIIRAVTRPLGGEPDDARIAVERIAKGDLTGEVPIRPGDTQSLLAALGTMQQSLRNMIGELTGNANGVAAAADQLVVASQQIATSSAHQSDAASSMASAVEEMTVSINQVSESATEARKVTRDAGSLSGGGSKVIDRTVAGMQAIADTVSGAAQTIRAVGDSSQNISMVVQVIKEVAEQTNLLALNAAIEAARAGEQGRGFAVVADEVRKLAERTAGATTDIGTMIEGMQSSAGAAVHTMEQAVSQVASGVSLAREAGDSMRQISSGTERAVASVNEISNALSEQSIASTEIATNVRADCADVRGEQRGHATGACHCSAVADARGKHARRRADIPDLTISAGHSHLASESCGRGLR
ncbi:hypothetical protein TMEC50S_02818 [Thauera mechernichensis]